LNLILPRQRWVNAFTIGKLHALGENCRRLIVEIEDLERIIYAGAAVLLSTTPCESPSIFPLHTVIDAGQLYAWMSKNPEIAEIRKH
jgi:nitroimidazol reductase NimA-like FMN-containing flavoprotein (pyridoxamine 5'-phosphate oxidase superfamily)